MSSRRIYRRTQIGDSNASSDSSICDKSKNFRCLLQGVVKKDQSASGLHTAVLDLQQRRINTIAVWTADKESITSDYSTSNKFEYPPNTFNLRAHEAEYRDKEHGNINRIVQSADTVRMNSTYPMREGNSSSQGSLMNIDYLEGATTEMIGHDAFCGSVRHTPLNRKYDQGAICHKQSVKTTTDNFTKYLGSSNLKLEEIPFFDIRIRELDGRRARAMQYDEECKDPELVARYGHLQKLEFFGLQ